MKLKINQYFILILSLFIFQQASFADVFQEGLTAFNKTDYLKAEKCFKYSLNSNPKNDSIRYYYATALFYNRKFDKAKSEYTYIIMNHPDTEAAIKAAYALNILNNKSIKNNIGKIEKDITSYKNVLILDDVVFNNKYKARMIVDTGASYTVINPEFAESLGINYANASMVRINTANGMVSAPKVILKSISIDGISANNIEVVIQDTGNVFGSSGLLGLSFLDKFKVTIDKKAGKLTLEKN